MAVGLALAAMRSIQGGGGDAFELTRPTTTYIGIGVTAQDPNFHVSVDLDHTPGATIRVVEVLAHTSSNVDFLGAVAIWPRDIKDVSVGAGNEFPPTSVNGTHPVNQVVPSAETLFKPKGLNAPAAVDVVAGFRLRAGDIGAMNGIRVVYEVDGKRLTKDSPQAGIACKPKGCDGPTGSDDPDFQNRVLREAGLLPKDS